MLRVGIDNFLTYLMVSLYCFVKKISTLILDKYTPVFTGFLCSFLSLLKLPFYPCFLGLFRFSPPLFKFHFRSCAPASYLLS
jgi:hypothetical protein